MVRTSGPKSGAKPPGPTAASVTPATTVRSARPARPILIAGGGIGGLAAALALADRGVRCRVLERRPTFSEAGAGIQIGPNGVRALRALGIDTALAPKVGTPDEIIIRDARRGSVLANLPLGSVIEARLGAPYWTAHRADLHAALLDRAQKHTSIALTTGFSAERLEATPDGVRVLATTGEAMSGAALIGADGLWSKVRRYVADQAAPRFAGRRAYRTVVSASAVPPEFQANATGLWLGRGAHVVHYPVRAGRELALVVILEDTSEGPPAWDQPVDQGTLLASATRLAPAVAPLLACAADWKSWSLYDAPPLMRWCNGRVALLGDAAHPVLPFLAQGGVLALEDALTLANCVMRSGADVEAGLLSYASTRMTRTRRVARASRRNGTIYHLSGPAAVARNLVLRAVPPHHLIAQYDWLYGWHPPGA